MRSLPLPSNILFWFTLALLVKGSFFSYKTIGENGSGQNKNYSTFFARETDDARSYFEPIENFLDHGNYGGGEFGDYRMPGYGIPYAALRFFFSPNTSLDILVILQLILASLAVYVLALIALRISTSTTVFYWTYFLFAISTYTSLFDHFLLTESFTVSACILGFYYFQDKKNPRTLVLSGLFFGWAVFLKPICAPIFLFAFFFLFRSLSHSSAMFRIRQIVLFLLPIFIFEAFWITYNFREHETFSPLTQTTYYPTTHNSYRKDLFDFLRSTGQTIVWWNKGTLASYFLTTDPTQSEQPNQLQYAYTSRFNGDSLVTVKNLIQQYDSNAAQSLPTTLHAEEIAHRLQNYAASVRAEKPFLYYIGSRLRLTKSFLVHSGTYNLFSKSFGELNKIQQFWKIFYSGLYLLFLAVGIFGAFYFFFVWKNNFLSTLALYFTLVFPLVLQLDEYRYLVPAYPFLLLTAILFIHHLLIKTKLYRL